MTDELGPAARALLDAAREGMAPDAAAIARVHGKVGAAVSGAGATAIAVKLAVLGAIAVVAVGAVVISQRGGAPSPTVATTNETSAPTTPMTTTPTPNGAPASARSAPSTAAPSASIATTPSASITAAPSASIATTPSPPIATAPSTSTSVATAPSTPAGLSSTAPSRTTPSASASKPVAIDADRIEIDPPTSVPRSTAIPAPPARGAVLPPSSSRPGLAREVELIDQAMAAMRRADYAAALAAVHQHAIETGGHGQLGEDAAAIDIEATCKSHHSVFAKLEAFDARWPASAQRSRLTNTCP